MNEEYITLESKADKLPLSVLIMTPDEAPTAIFQLVHGMAEHKERYRDFMEFMCQNGYVCIIHDHRGHGGSVKSDSDLGYFYDNGDVNVIKDIEQIGDYIDELYPDLPRYLFGHSMGSLAVRVYAAEHDDEIEGLIVCGSPSNNPAASFAIFLTDLISIFRGDKYRSKFINNIALGAFDKATGESGEFTWLSYYEANRTSFIDDEKCGFTFTLNGFKSLFSLIKQTYSPKIYDIRNKNLKILFISGEDDPCTINQKKFNESVTFMKDIGYKNIKSKMYPKMRHEILNETTKNEVYSDIKNFIENEGITQT